MNESEILSIQVLLLQFRFTRDYMIAQLWQYDWTGAIRSTIERGDIFPEADTAAS
jgi:hypothetical protein